MTRYLLAPLRCLILVLLAGYGLALALLSIAAATTVIAYPTAAVAIRATADLGRRLAARWGGVPINSPERGTPPEPQRRADGWYAYNNQLFRRRGVPAFLLKIEWLSKDGTLNRDWLSLFAAPFTAAVAAAVPVALIGGAVALLAIGSVPAGGLLAAAMIALAVGLGPAALRAHALASRVTLQPARESWWHRSGHAGRLRRAVHAAWAGGGLAGLSIVAFGLGLVSVLSIVVSYGWASGFVPRVYRPYLQFYRRMAREWTGAELPDPYRPMPEPPRADVDGTYRAGRTLHTTFEAAVRAQRSSWLLRDPQTWRDLAWMLTTPPMVLVSLIPGLVLAISFFGLVWQLLWWAPWAVPVGLSSGYWVSPFYMWDALTLGVPALAVIPGWASVLIGLVGSLLGCLIALPLQKLRKWTDGLLLAPTRATVLAQRVQRLTETRADAVDAQAAELRRIERDLHDGAQARLVAVGLNLATIEGLMRTDPDGARAVLAQARDSSAAALAELRSLVRGIHPPVLAERGLLDAVRAVALDSPLPVRVTAAPFGRLPAPLETAAYFAVCEAIANASRHAEAQTIEVELEHREGALRIRVTDDGQGGADPSRGTGLLGIQRRLATFDGTLHLTSPAGGPTVVTLEIPCAL